MTNINKYIFYDYSFCIGLYLPPVVVQLAAADAHQLYFKWSVITNNCSDVHYNILASKECGYCPNVTDVSSATCTLMVAFTDNVEVCIFRVQTVICGQIQRSSNVVTVNLKGKPICITSRINSLPLPPLC